VEGRCVALGVGEKLNGREKQKKTKYEKKTETNKKYTEKTE
jgi:hypothetical protein